MRGAEEGIYRGSRDVFNVTHAVWAPGRGGPRGDGTAYLRWLPNGRGGHLGPADPAGDILMRLLEEPGLTPPAPLERWPGHIAAPETPETPEPADAQTAQFSLRGVAGPRQAGGPRRGAAAAPGTGKPCRRRTAFLVPYA